MPRCYYSQSIKSFLDDSPSHILGELTKYHEFKLQEQQRNAWLKQIELLKSALSNINGHLLLEYSIPRMGKRADCVILCNGTIFLLEFKVGADAFPQHAIDQVTDYALDLKNFHAGSHDRPIVPILVSTNAHTPTSTPSFDNDGISNVMLSNGNTLAEIIRTVSHSNNAPELDADSWLNAGYKPTPTIIEAAQALYQGHSVEEISRSDAAGKNLTKTANAIFQIIEHSKHNRRKSICFLTGVPGAGKTLAGLNLASSHQNIAENEHAVFLSGNGPLVAVLQEALARNTVAEAKALGEKLKKGEALSRIKAFIQDLHHFRDYHLQNSSSPHEHVIIFDEAQRAWTMEQTAKFMKTKKGRDDFRQSEPEFLISVMDRQTDWATIICLIGGGQEINTGEAGLREWFNSLARTFPHWDIYISDKLTDSEYTQDRPLFDVSQNNRITFEEDLHLAVSVRSFRSEKVAEFIKALLDNDAPIARSLHQEIHTTYPIVLTRDLHAAKSWLRSKARGTERVGLLASSGGLRLKPSGIFVKADIDPCHWFLNPKDDIRSSHFLEDVATEFDVQGLELDWTCVAWDANFRHTPDGWHPKNFSGTRWTEVNNEVDRQYLKNAYRVLLTRARQGMVIFVPTGSHHDNTRLPTFYDQTFTHLLSLGLPQIKT
ncbi:MAG: DUF2075 domain-containing protein [Phycisphaerae bacterium]